MRGIVLAVIAMVLMATVAYSAGIPSVSVKRLGATGPLNVLSPVSAFTVEAWPYTFNTSSQVTAYRVKWFPTAGTGYYLIQVYLLNSAGSIVGSGQVTVNLTSIGTWRTDSVTLSTPVSIANVATVRVNIVFQGA